jgi:hypothetical protein
MTPTKVEITPPHQDESASQKKKSRREKELERLELRYESKRIEKAKHKMEVQSMLEDKREERRQYALQLERLNKQRYMEIARENETAREYSAG